MWTQQIVNNRLSSFFGRWMKVCKKILKWVVPYKKPWIIVSTPILGTNWRFWVVPRKNLGLQLVPRVPEGTNCKFWVVPTKKLGLQLVPRVLTADFGWSLQKNLGLQLVPRVLTVDFDQRVVVLLKFSEMQLVLMVSRINMLPPPPDLETRVRFFKQKVQTSRWCKDTQL